jgi:hypothetical protein
MNIFDTGIAYRLQRGNLEGVLGGRTVALNMADLAIVATRLSAVRGAVLAALRGVRGLGLLIKTALQAA